jgi:Putative MetA-pathway of phenol degradation
MVDERRVKSCTTSSLLILLLCLTPIVQQAFATEPEVTPYRPGVGSPAILSATGYFEIEAGADYLRGADARTTSAGLLVKYGLTDQLGLLIGITPIIRDSTPNKTQTGTGDSLLGAKLVNKVADGVSLGAQLVTSLPTGSKAFRSDKPTVNLIGLAGFDFSGLHSDINIGVTRVGDDPGGGVSRNRVGWSAALSAPLNGPLSGAIELSGTNQSGAGKSTQLLASLSYGVSKSLVLDVYAARARSGSGEERTYSTGVGAGLTYLFAK